MQRLAILLLAALSLVSCQSTRTAQGSVEHVVLTWLKRPGDPADRARLVATSKELKAGIPEIKHLSVGTALASDRSIVDDSFDVALVMRFASKADLSIYEKHPVHVKAVNEVIKPLTAKIVVHDFITE